VHLATLPFCRRLEVQYRVAYESQSPEAIEELASRLERLNFQRETHYRAERNKAILVVFRLFKSLISFGMTCKKLQGGALALSMAWTWQEQDPSLEQGNGKGAEDTAWCTK
jgi:hypothetical protein